MNIKQRSKILVVSHDAGGAEIISAYVKKNFDAYDFFCVLGGPAVNIFAKKKLKAVVLRGFENCPEKLFDSDCKIDLLLASIGWSSDLEHIFLREAKKRGIKTIVYLDHWVNYRERFGYPHEGWENNLTDEIWVGDEYAYKMANLLFAPARKQITLVPNPHFAEIKEDYKKFQTQKVNKKDNDAILFLSEPIGEAVNIFGDKDNLKYDEYDISDKLLGYLAAKQKKRKIIFRLHPSEKNDKYDGILNKYKDKVNICKSANKDLFADIIKAEFVIGMESAALVTALFCEKKVISFLPNANKECPLPFEQIIRIKNMEELDKIID